MLHLVLSNIPVYLSYFITYIMTLYTFLRERHTQCVVSVLQTNNIARSIFYVHNNPFYSAVIFKTRINIDLL